MLLPDEYKQLTKHIAGGTGFISNFMFWKEAGYFDNSANTKVMLHLWSLGIEEQFYIIWPLLLWGAWQVRLNLLYISLFIAFISFVLNINTVHSDATATFYLPQTRFWELLMGSILAYISINKLSFTGLNSCSKILLNKIIFLERALKLTTNKLQNICATLGALLIIYGLFRITKDANFPGNWALLPTIGTALVIGAGPQAWINRTILSNKILVWFGLISFPLYLWHWPLLTFAHIIEDHAISQNLILIAISVLLAWLTHVLIEKSIRFNKKIKPSILVILLAIVGCISYYSYKKDGFVFRVEGFQKIIDASKDFQFPADLKSFPFKEHAVYYKNSQKEEITLFVGDSIARQYYPRVNELIKISPLKTNSIMIVAGGGCPPFPNSHYISHKYCINLMEAALELALSKKKHNICCNSWKLERIFTFLSRTY